MSIFSNVNEKYKQWLLDRYHTASNCGHRGFYVMFQTTPQWTYLSVFLTSYRYFASSDHWTLTLQKGFNLHRINKWEKLPNDLYTSTFYITLLHPTQRPRSHSPEKFENGGFTLKTHQIFPFTSTRRNLKSQQSPITLIWICVRVKLGQGNHDYWTLPFPEKLRFENVFHSH